MIWSRFLNLGHNDLPIVAPILMALFVIVTLIVLIASIIGGVFG